MTSSGKQAKAGFDKVRAILHADWDPIGCGEMPDLPADEYDRYAPRVVSMIETGADDRAKRDRQHRRGKGDNERAPVADQGQKQG